MARRLRIQSSDAIYHVMARGNGRQDIVQDDADRGRLVACLERTVRRSGWSLYAFVFLTNHLHLVLKTPRPNLAKGMQLFLSSYANGWARRHRHCGHLFQGHYPGLTHHNSESGLAGKPCLLVKSKLLDHIVATFR